MPTAQSQVERHKVTPPTGTEGYAVKGSFEHPCQLVTHAGPASSYPQCPGRSTLRAQLQARSLLPLR